MQAKLTLDELTACGAHQKGHFLLSSGLHSGDYLQCALYLAHPSRAACAGGMLADEVTAAELKDEGYNYDVSPGGHMILTMNNASPDSAWSDIRMREALEYAIDKDGIAGMSYGYWKPLNQTVLPD